MRIGLDAMGGDFAPEAPVKGAVLALKELPVGNQIVLIGNTDQIRSILQEENVSEDAFEFIHTTEFIGMADHPTKAIAQKATASIPLGFQLLKDGHIDAFSSAGNTGAMLVGSMFSIKTVPGVIRPAMPTIVPKLKGGLGVILDVGANSDCRPDNLLQFGILGKLLLENIYDVKNPRVGLINIGEEPEKGNLLTQAAYALMRNEPTFNFIGNVEGRDLFNDMADVIVCDGFTGNVILKLAESFYTLTVRKGFQDSFFDRFNYEQYGGSPILGVNAPVVVGHGISSPEAIKNMILLSRDLVTARLTEKIRNIFN